MKTLVSAHNCVFGSRNLGIFGSTLKEWPSLEKQYDCFFIVDDCVGYATQPVDASTYADKAMFVGSQFLNAGIDPKRSSIVLASSVPEIFEIAYYMGLIISREAVETQHRKSFMSALDSSQRRQWGLAKTPTINEAYYPQFIIPSYVVGLLANVWQGGREVEGQHRMMVIIAGALNAAAGANVVPVPKMQFGNPEAVFASDGTHMGFHNQLSLIAKEEEIYEAIKSMQDSTIAANWADAVGEKSLARGIRAAGRLDSKQRNALGSALCVALRPFRESRVTNNEVLDAFSKGRKRARARLRETIQIVRQALEMDSYLNHYDK